MVVLLEYSPISTEEFWSSVRVTIVFLVTSLTKALLPQLLSLSRWPAQGRLLVVPNFFHLRLMEATVFLGDLQCCRHLLPRSLPRHNLVSKLYGQYLRPHGLLWHALSTVGPYIDRCMPFRIMFNQLKWPQVDSNQVVETFQGWWRCKMHLI